MKNNKGFTLIELLAVIVVLAIVMVLAATTVLPYMSKARENSFRIEATNIVKAAESAKDLYALNEIQLNSGTNASCKKAAVPDDPDTTGTDESKPSELCFTVAELINLGIYEADASTYTGRVIIKNYESTTPDYQVSFAKPSEFSIHNQAYTDYSDESISVDYTDLASTETACTCS